MAYSRKGRSAVALFVGWSSLRRMARRIAPMLQGAGSAAPRRARLDRPASSSSLLKPDLPPSAAIAAVCTVGYFGFLLGPPMIGGLAELIGLPAALGLVVLLCALIAALGSRAPPQRASGPARSSG